MIINKKGLLIGGGAALVAAYLLLGVGGADGNGAVEAIKARAGGILGAPTPGVAGGINETSQFLHRLHRTIDQSNKIRLKLRESIRLAGKASFRMHWQSWTKRQTS